MKDSRMSEEQIEALWKRAQQTGMTRRAFLILLASSGATAVLSACASAVTPSPTSPPAAAATTAPTAAATATVVRPTATLPPPTPSGPSGALRIGVSSFGGQLLDPVPLPRNSNVIELAPMFDFLIKMDPTETKNMGIAERWEIAPDGLSWTFYIRKGVKFHDGSALTAKDVKFSLDRFATSEAFQTSIKDSQDRVEIVDDYTVRVYTKGVQPYYYRYVNAVPAQQGMIMPKDFFEKVGKDYFSLHPIGSGPFKFVRYAPGDVIEYEALDSHFRQVPAFKTLSNILVPEEATRLAMLKTGALDAIEMSVDSVPEVEAAGLRTVVLAGNQASIPFWGANDPRAKSMPTADVRVRQALSLAINREEIGRTVYYGKLSAPMPPQMWTNQPEIDVPYWTAQAAKYYRYDPQAATQLLKDAGYPNGFTLKLYSFSMSGAASLPKLAPIIQGYWQKIGVKTEIVPTDYATQRTMGGTPAKGVVDALVGQATVWGADGNPHPPRSLSTFFSGKGTWDLIGAAQGQNLELSNLVVAASVEPDPAKRKEMIAKALLMAMDTYLCLVIGTVPSMAGLGPLVDIEFPPGALSIPVYAEITKHRKQ